MSKYHDYSVKSALESYFGKEPLEIMRAEHERWMDADDVKGLIPRAWEQADEKMLFLCQAEYFLLDTRLYDDYIAYIVQEKHHKTAILTFLHFTDKPFLLDPQYAMDLTCQWKQKGYDVLLACIHIKTTQMTGYDGKKLIEFDPRAARAGAVELLRAKEICGKSILVREEPLPCWIAFKRNFVSAVQLNRVEEYKCLLSDDVTVFEGDDDDKTELTSGFRKVVDHLSQITAPRLVYAVFRGDLLYTRTVIAGDREILLDVNATNQIHEIIERPVQVEKLEILPAEDVPGISLVEQMPEIMAVRPLDPATVHAYAIQVDFSDESVRNYYLAAFDSLEIPEGLTIEGSWFSCETVKSVRPYRDGNGSGICFDNGFSIPVQILYYRGYIQLKPERTEGCIFQNDVVNIMRQHRTPLLVDWHRGGPRYFGSDSEYHGPSNAILKPDGSRASIASYWKIWDSIGLADIALVTVEPTGKAGYIRKEDGTWLFPPAYESATQFGGFQYSIAVAERRVDNKLSRILLTRSGKEIPWKYHLDEDSCFNGLCPFSVIPPEYDKDQLSEEYDNLEAGIWGYINDEGEIIVEPQYAYATSFYCADGVLAIVAKRTENGLRWGAIDTSGREFIPCKYRNLYTRCDNALIYQTDDAELCGLLDMKGNIIIKPRFRYIREYDQKHELIACGDYEGKIGVYSIPVGKMIVPEKYDYISFDDSFMSCEIPYTGTEVYYDYDGNELHFGDYDRVHEPYNMPGYLWAWKDGKCALLKMDGTVLNPLAEKNGSNYEYYNQGFLITGSVGRLGLKRVSGETILPERYSKITICEDFVIASLQAQSAGSVSDELYTLDGKLILGGAYRNILIHDGTMKAETPNGIEYYTICSSSQENG